MPEPLFLTDGEGSSVTDALIGLAQRLRESDYTVTALSDLLQTGTIFGLDALEVPFWRRRAANGSALGLAARLFLLEDVVPSAQAEALLDRPLLTALARIGLVVSDGGTGLRSVVNLYPVNRLIVATDPVFFWRGLPFERPTGFEVYCVGRDSFELAQAVPGGRAPRVLDLCTGSGIQALCAASHADEVVAIDVNPRAIRFARMNARMNEIGNVTFIEGDLFAPVADRTFERIVANPPFVGVPPGEGTLFRDGGRAGDQVLRRIISGLPQHLAADGDAFVVSELGRRPAEDELFTPLAEGGFDVLILDLAHYDVHAKIFYHARSKLLNHGWDAYAAEVDRWLDYTVAAGIERFSYSVVALRRHEHPLRLTRQTLPPRTLFPDATPALAIRQWRQSR